MPPKTSTAAARKGSATTMAASTKTSKFGQPSRTRKAPTTATVKHQDKQSDFIPTRSTSYDESVAEASASPTMDDQPISPIDATITLVDGSTLTVADYMDDADMLVIVVYSRASTPSCTKQAQAFGDSIDELKEAGCAVLGASLNDSAESQRKFQKILPFSLAIKPKDLLESLNCVEADGSKGIRSVVAIDREGEIIYEQHKVKPDACFKHFMEFVRKPTQPAPPAKPKVAAKVSKPKAKAKSKAKKQVEAEAVAEEVVMRDDDGDTSEEDVASSDSPRRGRSQSQSQSQLDDSPVKLKKTRAKAKATGGRAVTGTAKGIEKTVVKETRKKVATNRKPSRSLRK